MIESCHAVVTQHWRCLLWVHGSKSYCVVPDLVWFHSLLASLHGGSWCHLIFPLSSSQDVATAASGRQSLGCTTISHWLLSSPVHFHLPCHQLPALNPLWFKHTERFLFSGLFVTQALDFFFHPGVAWKRKGYMLNQIKLRPPGCY